MTIGRQQPSNNFAPANVRIPIKVQITGYYFPFYFRSEGYRDKQWKPGGNIMCLAGVNLFVEGMAYPITLNDLQIRPNKEGTALSAFVPSRNERDAISGDDKWVRAVELPKALSDAIASAINTGEQALTDTILAEVYKQWYPDCSEHYPETAEVYSSEGFPGWINPDTCAGYAIGDTLAGNSRPAAPAPPAPRQAAPAVARPAAPQPPAPTVSAPPATPAPAAPPKAAPRRPAPAPKPEADDDLEDPFAE